jgi:hypothetical protein
MLLHSELDRPSWIAGLDAGDSGGVPPLEYRPLTDGTSARERLVNHAKPGVHVMGIPFRERS